MTLYTEAESNIRKTWLYLSFFLILIVALGWLVSYYLGNSAILILAVVFSFGTSFFSYWYSDKIVLAISRAQPIAKNDSPELYRIIENLCITAGLPLPKIYILDEAQPNAFATGRDKNHAAIAITRGLLERLEKPELEGVISHELSHIGNRDTLLETVVVVLVGIIVLITDFFYRLAYWERGGRRERKGKGVRFFS